MRDSDFDWTFDHIPPEAEAAPAPVQRGDPAARRPRRLTRRAWLVLLLAAVLASAGAAAWVRAGWLRLQAQVSAAVVYEDERARAGQVALAAGDDGEWQHVRQAEAGLGLPAPLPAAQLLPAPGAPRVLRVDAASSSVLVATVERTYTDSAGQAYRFALEQRYRNRGPGLWERLPPDQAPLAPKVQWTGQRMVATLPRADWPLLQTILPGVDALLERNCADWGDDCGDFKVPVEFVDALSSLALPRLPARGGQPGTAAAYPLTFDLARDPSRSLGRVTLPSPHLAGVPQDAAAVEALTRAVAASALLAFADQLAGPGSHGADLYRDALVARAEVRLGLAARPGLPGRSGKFISPNYAWGLTHAALASGPEALSLQLQALSFLDYALRSQPPAADALLLQTLRFQPNLVSWLHGALGWRADSVLPGWIEQVNAQTDPGRTIPLSSLGGLAFGCQAGAWLVRDGLTIQLPFSGPSALLAPEALSPDGRTLAVAASGLSLLDVDSGGGTFRIGNRGDFVVLGWADDDVLVYLRRAPGDPRDSFTLMSYQRSLGRSVPLTEFRVPRVWLARPEWSADRERLALTLATGTGSDLTGPALVAVTAPDQVTWLAPEGHGVALSPDGSWAAYVDDAAYVGGLVQFGTNVELLDLHSDTYRSLVTGAALNLGSRPVSIAHLTWSPDSRQLAFAAYGQSRDVGLFLAAVDGSALRRLAYLDSGAIAPRFSADGRYLSYYDPSAPNDGQLDVLELAGGGASAHGPAFAGAWSPAGHRLAVASTSGVYVTDPATNATRWLSFDVCYQVEWYRVKDEG